MAGKTPTPPQPDRAKRDYKALVAEHRAQNADAAPTFDIDGYECRLRPPLEWSDDMLEMQAALEDPDAPGKLGLMVKFVRELLGDDYAEFKARGGKSAELMAVLPDIIGGEAGESAAS